MKSILHFLDTSHSYLRSLTNHTQKLIFVVIAVANHLGQEKLVLVLWVRAIKTNHSWHMFFLPEKKRRGVLLFSVPLIYAIEAIFTLNHLYSFCVTFSVIISTYEVYLLWILMAVRVFLWGKNLWNKKTSK